MRCSLIYIYTCIYISIIIIDSQGSPTIDDDPDILDGTIESGQDPTSVDSPSTNESSSGGIETNAEQERCTGSRQGARSGAAQVCLLSRLPCMVRIYFRSFSVRGGGGGYKK